MIEQTGMILLADGSWGSLAGAIVFSWPAGFDPNEVQDEHDLTRLIENGEIPVTAVVSC